MAHHNKHRRQRLEHGNYTHRTKKRLGRPQSDANRQQLDGKPRSGRQQLGTPTNDTRRKRTTDETQRHTSARTRPHGQTCSGSKKQSATRTRTRELHAIASTPNATCQTLPSRPIPKQPLSSIQRRRPLRSLLQHTQAQHATTLSAKRCTRKRRAAIPRRTGSHNRSTAAATGTIPTGDTIPRLPKPQHIHHNVYTQTRNHDDIHSTPPTARAVPQPTYALVANTEQPLSNALSNTGLPREHYTLHKQGTRPPTDISQHLLPTTRTHSGHYIGDTGTNHTDAYRTTTGARPH